MAESNVQFAPGSTIAVASDHAGVAMKTELTTALRALGFSALDLGPQSEASVDYPDYAAKVCQAVMQGTAAAGVLICGTGIGMSIAANRYAGIRAALCRSGLEARLTREHNNANMLVLGARISGSEVAKDALREFLLTPFAGGRHQQRIDKIESLKG